MVEPRSEVREISSLKLWDKNPRGINKADFERLKRSIVKRKQYKPLLVTEDGIVLGGNMRLRAFQELGVEKVWVSVVHAPDDKTKLEYALSDNDRAGYYEDEKLAELILENDGIDLEEFKVDLADPLSLAEIKDRFAPDEVIEDEAPNLDDQSVPESKPGEIYQLGRHRLMCGDSTKKEDVEKLMDGKKADMVFTSPPYNINSGMYETYTDDLKSEEYIEFNIKTVEEWKKHLKGYLFWNISYNKNARWEFLEIMYRIIKETGLRFLELVVWDKGHGIPITAKGQLTRQYEDILVVDDQNKDIELFSILNNQKTNVFNKRTGRGLTNYWRIDTANTQIDNHLACYPVKLPAKAIQVMTKEGDMIADPFGGSGSTLIACEQLNRRCYMMELDPKYCDVIRKRYYKFIGREDEWSKIT